MTDWLPLALLCAISLAAADTATKRLLGTFSAAELVIVRFTLPGVLLIPVFLWNLPPWPDAEFWPWIILAMPLEILAMLLYVIAIRDSPLSLTLPYLAFTPVFTSASGFLLLGESIPPPGLLGIALVVLGAYWLNIDRTSLSQPQSWLAPLVMIGRERGSRYMLLAAMIYGVTSVLGKGAMQYMPGLAFGPFYFMVLGTLAFMVFAIREPSSVKVVVTRYWPAWLVAGLVAVMIFTHFLALERVETAYMISVKRTSLLFSILLGHLVFHEGNLTRNFLAGTIMVIGVAIIIL
jgi:drug/metabolite transporter (DMT)-like permease